jgi:hypothetical protein
LASDDVINQATQLICLHRYGFSAEELAAMKKHAAELRAEGKKSAKRQGRRAREGRDLLTVEVMTAGEMSYRGASTQNPFPSGSAKGVQPTSPWPMSMRAAPSETRRSTSDC